MKPHDFAVTMLVCLMFSAALFAAPAGWAQDKAKTDHQEIQQQLRVLQREFRVRMEAMEKRLERLEGRKSRRSPVRRKIKPGSPTVCSDGCAHTSLYRAIRAARPGDTITVAPGRYAMCATIKKSLKIIGLKAKSGARAHLRGRACGGKAALVVQAPNMLIQGLEISNIRVRDRNGACFRVETRAADLTIRDVYCHDSENGILGGPKSGTTTILNSVFERNGAGKGQAHGMYITSGDGLVLRNTRIISSKGQGHTLKSGARRTLVEDSVLAALEGNNSRAIDFFGGGELIVRRSVIQQGRNSDNHEFFGIALEKRRRNPAPHKTVLEDNWIIYDDTARCCRWLFSARVLGPFIVKGNRLVGLTKVNEPSIVDQVKADNRLYANRKAAGLPPYNGKLDSLPKPGKN